MRDNLNHYGAMESDHDRPIDLMTAWIALAACLVVLGGVIGWIVRAVVTR